MFESVPTRGMKGSEQEAINRELNEEKIIQNAASPGGINDIRLFALF
jgi:hypothetical protein